MSVSLTQGICGIVIDGLEIDTHPDSLLKNADGIVGEKATTQANAERPHRYKKPDIDGNKVSGKFWHTDSKPLFKLKEKHLPSSTEREYRKEKINEVKNLIKDRKREIQEKIEHRRRQLAATKIRKEENKLKGNTYQVITNVKKIRKWSKKAKNQLMRMPKDMFEKYLLKHKHENARNTAK